MLRSLLTRFCKDEEAIATVDFVIAFPVFMWFFLTIFETGVVASRMVLLEHGLDKAGRQIRLGDPKVMTHDGLKDEICKYSRILGSCDRDLILEVVELDLNSAYPQNAPNCRDRTDTIAPTINFTPAGRSRIMFVRACMIIDPLFPGHGMTFGLQSDAQNTGGLQLVAYTAFMSEPP